jgi:hypothetical protein
MTKRSQKLHGTKLAQSGTKNRVKNAGKRTHGIMDFGSSIPRFDGDIIRQAPDLVRLLVAPGRRLLEAREADALL